MLISGSYVMTSLCLIILLLSITQTYSQPPEGHTQLTEHNKAVVEMIGNTLMALIEVGKYLAENMYKIKFALLVIAYQPINLITFSVVNADIIASGVSSITQLIA